MPSAGVINVTSRLFHSHLSCFYHHGNSWIVQHYALIWVNLQQFVASKFSKKYLWWLKIDLCRAKNGTSDSTKFWNFEIFTHKLWIPEENYFFHLCWCINFIFLLICTSVVYSMKWKTKNEENSENLRLCCGCETLLDSDFDLWPMKLWEFPPIASFLLLSVNVEQLTLSLFIHMATTMPCFLNKYNKRQ